LKIRHPLLINLLGRLIAWAVRLWIGTVRYRCRALGPRVAPTEPGLEGRYIYAFWHETMLLPAYHYRKTPTHVLISQHADGEMIAQACRYLGLSLVRGSSTRGGRQAVREIVELNGRSHLVITPDGPRGPRRQAQTGVVYLAAKIGLPVVPVGFACKKAWRIPSWDRFILPHFFTDAVGVLGQPIHVPRDAGKEELEQFRLQVENALEDAMNVAEEMVQGRINSSCLAQGTSLSCPPQHSSR
jgi:lysophospholipid acyltransferase (LPLAT)-like uncharacterized protein